MISFFINLSPGLIWFANIFVVHLHYTVAFFPCLLKSNLTLIGGNRGCQADISLLLYYITHCFSQGNVIAIFPHPFILRAILIFVGLTSNIQCGHIY